MPGAPSSVLAPSSKALVSTSFLLLLVRHLHDAMNHLQLSLFVMTPANLKIRPAGGRGSSTKILRETVPTKHLARKKPPA